ncbi:MAG TPA: hypothetical protein PLU49_13730 [Saprospiraceae bacterium]|nr:hypothetical protein [Saprospiraceae bacterium]
MKIVLKILFFVLATTVSFQSKACDFIFKVQGEVKEVYKVGDEIIVVVTMKLSHRVCNETLNEVKFNFSGLKVAGATKWTETNPNEYERKFKLVVEPDAKGNCNMSALRSCDKDGGSGTISFKVK